MVYAGLMVFGLVFLMGSLENLVRDNRPIIYVVYAAPLLLTALFFVAMLPSPTRIWSEGVSPSRPLLARWFRPFRSWHDLAAVYPSYYDVTGAFVSPFASSDGKVTQMGLALEAPSGRVETVKFTPSRFTMWESASDGYKHAIQAVRTAYGTRPLVPSADTFGRDEAAAMMARAKRPFLPFWAIVVLFASAAPVLMVLVGPLGLPIKAGLPLSLIAPVAVSLRSYAKSRERNGLLNALSKAAEFQRGQA